MIEVGRVNNLKVVKQESFGLYLDAEHLGNILLPNRYVPDGAKVGDLLDVFIYFDSEDIPIATTETPLAMVGESAYLKVVDVNNVGAFLDWGLTKDLLVPFGEQHKPLEIGRSYVVCIYLDAAFGRITASSKLSRHLQEFSTYFKPDQQVDLLICGKSDMGYKAVVDNTHLGLIYKDEAFKELKYGARLKGYIKSIREDRKLNLSIQPHAGKGRDELVEKIISHLRSRNGVSSYTDKAAPELIYKEFNVSKGAYKKALGRLYKERKIEISSDSITLL